jgi:hypothetical protein
VLIFALMLRCSPLVGQQEIRQVDFKNFAYPLSGNLLGHRSLEWLDVSPHPAIKRRTIDLVGGSQLKKISSVVVGGKDYGQYEGFTFQSVSYGDVLGDGKEEAIVTLMWQSGGTQTTSYVYVYGLGEHGPQLLAYCHTGDRSDSGLYGLYVRNNLLVFELFDPGRASAECCSSGVLVSSYKWQNGVFKLTGSIKRRTLPPAQEHPDK